MAPFKSLASRRKERSRLSKPCPSGVLTYQAGSTSTWCCLHVEDELVLRPFFAVSFLVFDFGSIDGKAIAEHLVHRQQSGGHTAASAEKLAARKALCFGRLLSQV